MDDFLKFRELIYKLYGIYFSEMKRDILQTKLNKLMSRHRMRSYGECYEKLVKAADKSLLNDFANEITVNYTSFFRESAHFDFIRENAAAWLKAKQKGGRDGELRIWSSACSTGEEPYTLAMVLKEALPAGTNIRILATDINRKVLSKAQQGFYAADIKNEVERYYLEKYFHKVSDGYLISEEIRSLVAFRQFNLLHDFPFINSFDMVFCRNVMIYFDAVVRKELVDRFFSILHAGGLLFIGHAESIAGQAHRFRYVQPAVYAKS
jgi:chemotaxis protein methyltransferase CheR